MRGQPSIEPFVETALKKDTLWIKLRKIFRGREGTSFSRQMKK
jgi:hypothetical protein